MADFTVSRMQQRRGFHVDLPQPLRPGEYGWCFDTNRLFIGGLTSQVPPSIQINADYRLEVESALADKFIVVTVDSPSFVFSDFVTHMATLVSASNIVLADVDTVYVALTDAQVVTEPGAVGTLIASADNVVSHEYGLPVSIDSDGVFELSNHSMSAAAAKLLNTVTGNAAVNVKLNVEVITEYSHPSSAFRTIVLPNTSSAWLPIPASAIDLVFDVNGAIDTFEITYSARYVASQATNFREMGKLEVLVDDNFEEVELTQSVNRMGNDAGALTFRTYDTGSGIHGIEYMSGIAADVMFRYKIESWASYDTNYVL